MNECASSDWYWEWRFWMNPDQWSRTRHPLLILLVTRQVLIQENLNFKTSPEGFYLHQVLSCKPRPVPQNFSGSESSWRGGGTGRTRTNWVTLFHSKVLLRFCEIIQFLFSKVELNSPLLLLFKLWFECLTVTQHLDQVRFYWRSKDIKDKSELQLQETSERGWKLQEVKLYDICGAALVLLDGSVQWFR